MLDTRIFGRLDFKGQLYAESRWERRGPDSHTTRQAFLALGFVLLAVLSAWWGVKSASLHGSASVEVALEEAGASEQQLTTMTPLRATPTVAEAEGAEVASPPDGLRDPPAEVAEELTGPESELPNEASLTGAESEGIDLLRLTLIINDRDRRGLVEQHKALVVVRQYNGARLIATYADGGQGWTFAPYTSSTDVTLGQRQINLKRSSEMRREVDRALLVSGRMPLSAEYKLVFTPEADEVITAVQRQAIEPYSEDILDSRERGVVPVMIGCWLDGEFTVSNLSMGTKHYTLGDSVCE